MTRRLVFVWGVGGVAALLGWATVRLGRQGVAVLYEGLSPAHWLVLALLVVAFAWGEGVMALDRRWAPRVVERAWRLADRRLRPLHLLAPLHAMGLVAANRSTLLRSWLGVGAIAVAILLIRGLPEPWKGMIDLAVALALAWGVGALLRRAVQADQALT